MRRASPLTLLVALGAACAAGCSTTTESQQGPGATLYPAIGSAQDPIGAAALLATAAITNPDSFRHDSPEGRRSAPRPGPAAPAITGSCEVVESDGLPTGSQVCHNLLVALLDSQGKEVSVQRPDERGSFRFVAIRPGSYRVRAERAGWKATVLPERPVAPGDAIRITLSRSEL